MEQYQLKGKLKYIRKRLDNIETQEDIKYKGQYYFKEMWEMNNLLFNIKNDLDHDIVKDIRNDIDMTFTEWLNNVIE